MRSGPTILPAGIFARGGRERFREPGDDLVLVTGTELGPAEHAVVATPNREEVARHADLAQRGLLPETVGTWYGEFGRTPRVANEAPWFGGRHHWGQVFSAVVAGGGFKGGRVVGSSDGRGEAVRDRPVYPWDLSASIYKLLGIDPHGKLPHPHGCVAYVSPASGGAMPGGGLLTEIMA